MEPGRPFVADCTSTECSFEAYPIDANTWSWDFGDDQSATGRTPSHSYEQDGDYNVQLTVVFGTIARTYDRTIRVGSSTVPGKPQNVQASGRDAKAVVSWERPDDGGSPIAGYTIKADPAGTETQVEGDVEQATVSGLSNGTEYTFAVAAENQVGSGPFSEPSNPVTPIASELVPTPPKKVAAAAGDGSAHVTWQEPDDDRGSPVTGYTVEVSPGDRTVEVSAPETSADVTGLTNRTEYTFRVMATNANGDSKLSAPSDPILPAPPKVPGKPLITQLIPRDEQVRVSWSPPDTGSSGLTGYRITAQPGGASVEPGASATDAVVPGLANGTEYTFTIVAINGHGAGELSDPAAATPEPGEAPMAPPITSVIPLDGAIDVQWVEPPDGGSPITGYTVTVQPGDHKVTTPADTTVARITGLDNDTAHTVAVTASNKIGKGPAAIEKNITPMEQRPPAPPKGVQAEAAGDGSVELHWQPPVDTGTSPDITKYTVTARPATSPRPPREPSWRSPAWTRRPNTPSP